MELVLVGQVPKGLFDPLRRFDEYELERVGYCTGLPSWDAQATMADK